MQRISLLYQTETVKLNIFGIKISTGALDNE